jgi:predicted exporter
MTNKKQDVALIGAGAAACAVCCAGPILGFFAAIGFGTLVGVALFGVAGLAIAALGVIIVLRRRRQRDPSCRPNEQAIELIQRR